MYSIQGVRGTMAWGPTITVLSLVSLYRTVSMSLGLMYTYTRVTGITSSKSVRVTMTGDTIPRGAMVIRV